eukprot:4622584-Pyramimonas_sp.AAC.1
MSTKSWSMRFPLHVVILATFFSGPRRSRSLRSPFLTACTSPSRSHFGVVLFLAIRCRSDISAQPALVRDLDAPGGECAGVS